MRNLAGSTNCVSDETQTSLTVSLSEIDAMALKAARGCGLSWGLAEEAGKACRWLAAWRLPGPEMLARILNAVDGRVQNHAPVLEGNRLRGSAGLICPIQAGAALSDRADMIAAGARIDLKPILSPLFMAPFLCRAARDLDCVFCVREGRIALFATPNGPASGCWERLVSWRHEAGSRQQPLEIFATEQFEGEPVSHIPDGCIVGHRIWGELDRFAQRTYVPASEHSRIAGAGSTQSDCD